MSRSFFKISSSVLLGATILGAGCGADSSQRGRAAAEKARSIEPASEVRDAAGLDAFFVEDEAFFRNFSYVGTLEAERYGELESAARQATTVVVATVSDIKPTRVIGNPKEGIAEYVGVVLRPREVLVGTLPEHHRHELVVEFLGSRSSSEDLRRSLPQGQSVWFLRNKADFSTEEKVNPPATDESGFYRLISSQGLFIQGSDHVVNPVREREGPEIGETPENAERRSHLDDPVSEKGESYRQLGELVTHLRSVRK
ncbi:MAG: hypothetical protein ACRDV9_11185 [Acidimicrobiia bacterium]